MTSHDYKTVVMAIKDKSHEHYTRFQNYATKDENARDDMSVYVIRSRSLNYEFCGSLSMYMLCMLYINRLTVNFKIF